MPNDFGLHREGVLWSTPGKGAALYSVLESKEIHGFLVFARPNPPIEAFRDPEAQRELVAGTFAGEGRVRDFVERNQATVSEGRATLAAARALGAHAAGLPGALRISRPR